jgi:hypothetical protein
MTANEMGWGKNVGRGQESVKEKKASLQFLKGQLGNVYHEEISKEAIGKVGEPGEIRANGQAR